MTTYLKIFIITLLAALPTLGLAQPALIPSPKAIELAEGNFKAGKKIGVAISDASLQPAAEYLAESLSAYGEIADTPADKADIELRLAEPDSLLSVKGAYRLEISKNKVNLTAATYSGIINGISTLRQLMPIEAKRLTLPCLSISDAPDFWWRGMHLDSARHFWTIAEIEQYIDLMALYKMSVFHWHLIDDQGWRVESDRYPELTAKGAWRKFNEHDLACEKASAENPAMRLPRDRMTTNEQGDTVYGGFYTKADLRHIVDFAARRGIEVVPEFDVPGHSLMLTSVHNELACGGVPNSSVCPGKDATVEFCQNIFAELFEIFPSKYVHVGGDEVEKSRWHDCADCARRVAEEGLESPEELQAWFMRRMELFFRNNGRTLIGWDEIAHDGLGSETAIMWWRADNRDVVKQATDAGKHVTCTPTSCMYFDYPQPETEFDKILALDLLDGLTPRQQRLVNGLQANVWAEYIPSVSRIQYQIFPRMIAMAESAWHSSPSERISAEEFRRLVPAHLKRLEAMGINYQALSD